MDNVRHKAGSRRLWPDEEDRALNIGMMRIGKSTGFLLLLALVAMQSAAADSAARSKTQPAAKPKTAPAAAASKAAPATPARKTAAGAVSSPAKTAAPATRTTAAAKPKTAAAKAVPRKKSSPWSEPTFADSTKGDDISGEDLAVRRAAVLALGPYNGSIVAVDAMNGRVLAMVNQRLALQSGFQPCSTVKLPVAVAGLVENLVARDTPVRIGGPTRLTLTEAMARSNNPYFAILGAKLGFDRLSYYSRLLGLGELAGLNIEGERPGAFPKEQPRGTSLAMMSSFGEGISLTPLQLAAMLSVFANGGTLYYLQYPRSPMEVRDFMPRVKRRLDIERWLPDLTAGMSAAVEYGTGRRAGYDPAEPVFGKTGTCTEKRTHLGWFGSYNEAGHNRLVVVVLLTGGHGVSGPTAAQIAGDMYKRLSADNFFARDGRLPPTAMVPAGACCSP